MRHMTWPCPCTVLKPICNVALWEFNIGSSSTLHDGVSTNQQSSS